MTNEEIKKHLTSLYNKVRKNYNFASGNYICQASFREILALRETIEAMERRKDERLYSEAGCDRRD